MPPQRARALPWLLLGACVPAPAKQPVTPPPSPTRSIQLEPIGLYSPPPEEPHGTEIPAYDPGSARLFVTNSVAGTVDVLDLHDPRAPQRIAIIDVHDYGGAQVTSIDVADGLLAIALVAAPAQQPGSVLLLRAADLAFVNQLRVAALPDMITFTPDHTKLVVACEGEPSPDLHDDPAGVLAIVELGDDPAEAGPEAVHIVGFEQWAAGPIDPRIHVHSASQSVAQDLEPEYVAVSSESRTAWVSLQENNALAIVDLESATLRDVIALGETPLAKPDSEAFAGGRVFGMRQPDAVALVHVGGRDHVITANEGDCRAYPAMPERVAAAGLRLDPESFPDAATLQRDDVLGRVAVSAEVGDLDHDGDYDELHACGSRSISVWTADGELVWDSGALLERLSAADMTNVSELGLDTGPAPEGLVVGELWQRPYVFVGLEGPGAIAAFDLSDPRAPSFVLYEHVAGDVGPEGIELIAAEHSPIAAPLLIVANEVSRTVRIYRVLAGAGG